MLLGIVTRVVSATEPEERRNAPEETGVLATHISALSLGGRGYTHARLEKGGRQRSKDAQYVTREISRTLIPWMGIAAT